MRVVVGPVYEWTAVSDGVPDWARAAPAASVHASRTMAGVNFFISVPPWDRCGVVRGTCDSVRRAGPGQGPGPPCDDVSNGSGRSSSAVRGFPAIRLILEPERDEPRVVAIADQQDRVL